MSQHVRDFRPATPLVKWTLMNLNALETTAEKLLPKMPDGGFRLVVHGPLGEVAAVERNWKPHALVPVWSSTKGPAATTLLWVMEQAGLSLNTQIASVWPEFRHPVSIGQLLSHQGGLAAPAVDVSVFDHAAAAAALADQEANWTPGTAHGYHPRSFGFILDEISLRLCGERIGPVWQREIARPLGVDFFIGLPESEFPRVVLVKPGRASTRPEEREFIQAYSDARSLTRRAFDRYKGLNAPLEFNHRKAWQLASPAFGGVGSADGLARFYAVLAGDGGGIFSDRLRLLMEEEQVSGMDAILKMPTAFTAGFQKDPLDTTGRKLRQHYGPSTRAFGHPGAGGSFGFADPEAGWGVGFTLSIIGPGVFPSEEIIALVDALYL